MTALTVGRYDIEMPVLVKIGHLEQLRSTQANPVRFALTVDGVFLPRDIPSIRECRLGHSVGDDG